MNKYCSITPKQMFDYLSHDGTEVVFPGYNVPLCCRGFHIAELVHLCYLYNLSCSEFPAELALVSPSGEPYNISTPYNLDNIIHRNDGVIITDRHALSWVDGKCIDPDTLNEIMIPKSIRAFFLIMIMK